MAEQDPDEPGAKRPRRGADEELPREATEDPPREEKSRFYRFGRKLLDRGDDVRDMASAVLETSDRAKTEMVRMVAREVRNYLDELKLKEDAMALLRSHSLEVSLSLHLKPLAPEAPAPAPVTARATKRDTEGT